MNSVLVAENLGKTFSRRLGKALPVLSGIQFSLSEGERVAIVGKSGAGKSTLLHLLGTLEEPTEGRVLFHGKDVFRFKETELSRFRNRELGFVFQFHYLMLEFTALENVMIPCFLAGKSRAEAKKAATDLLKRVGLSERMEHKPGQLSGGEQQRVAIARALVMRPKLLLTDEMTGNLDPATGSQVMDLIADLHREYGMALVSVTHDENLARTYPKTYRLTGNSLELLGTTPPPLPVQK